MVTDYWHFNGTANVQLLVYATNHFQLFKIDSNGRRQQIHGQSQTSTVVTAAASTLTPTGAGDYFLLNGPNNLTNYYVWYNVDAGNSDPTVSNRTGVPVAVAAGDTDAQVATATAAAIDALSLFSAAAVTNTVTITANSAGVTDEIADFNTSFAFSTTKFGATAPATSVSTIRTNKFNERLEILFSGIGNFPIIYNPDEMLSMRV